MNWARPMDTGSVMIEGHTGSVRSGASDERRLHDCRLAALLRRARRGCVGPSDRSDSARPRRRPVGDALCQLVKCRALRCRPPCISRRSCFLLAVQIDGHGTLLLTELFSAAAFPAACSRGCWPGVHPFADQVMLKLREAPQGEERRAAPFRRTRSAAGALVHLSPVRERLRPA